MKMFINLLKRLQAKFCDWTATTNLTSTDHTHTQASTCRSERTVLGISRPDGWQQCDRLHFSTQETAQSCYISNFCRIL